MTHFRTKTQLIEWLERHCKRNAIVRALDEGQIELLGGFANIPPLWRPGFILKVTSVYKKEWIIAITDNLTHWGIMLIKKIPWRYWVGDKKGLSELFAGDNPLVYKELRNEAIGKI